MPFFPLAAVALLDMDLRIRHFFDDDKDTRCYAKQTFILPGETATTESHTYPHLSIYVGGPFVMTVDGVETAYVKGAGCIVVAAHKKHSVRAEGYIDWFCIHATTERDPALVDATLIEGK